MGGRGASSHSGGKFSFSNGVWSNGPSEKEPATLRDALGVKGAPHSIGDSIVETNPYHTDSYREFSENCQRVVVAYELRRRGYDVMALPTFQGDTLNQIAYLDTKNNIFHGRWRGAFQNAKSVDVSVDGNNAAAERGVIDNISSKMREYGNGARGVVQILYRGGGGHVFNVENQNGRTVWIEAQSGKIKDIERVMKFVDTGSVSLTRTDNLRISDRTKRFVQPDRGRKRNSRV